MEAISLLYVNKIMSVKNNIQLIYDLLAHLDDQGRTPDQQKLYELGFLVGLLARLANDDSLVYARLKGELKKHRQNKSG